MAAWSDGYHTDIQYTAKSYAELAPGFLAFACLRQGVRPPDFGPGSTYLELGCGQGFGLNILAAANPAASFWGVDFHPAQIDNAIRQARAGGLSNVIFEDLSFEQLLALPDGHLPRFDVITLHGVYSWVSAENRAIIVRIFDKLLKPGGMVYVSYNCMPGWAGLAPLQNLIAEHAARTSGSPQTRVVAALQAARQMAEAKAGYFEQIPFLKERIEEALRESPAYLVHEYLNQSSQPLFHAEVVRAFDDARLSYAASAGLADDLVHLAAPAAMQKQILETHDRTWRETLLDYASAKSFRRDIFVRGRNALTPFERDALLDGWSFALVTPPADVVTEFPVPIGRMTGHPAVYGPIIEALAAGAKTYAELRGLPALAGAREGAVLQAITILTGGRQIHPLAQTACDTKPALAFNRAIAARAAAGESWSYVAAPRLGAGVHVDFADMVAMHRRFEGVDDADACARSAWPGMLRSGRRLLKDGATLEDQASNQAELSARIEAFSREKLPLFQGLGAI